MYRYQAERLKAHTATTSKKWLSRDSRNEDLETLLVGLDIGRSRLPPMDREASLHRRPWVLRAERRDDHESLPGQDLQLTELKYLP